MKLYPIQCGNFKLDGGAMFGVAIIVMIAVFTSPTTALVALLWIIGIYVIVFGIFLIVMAFMARSQAKRAMNG